MIFPDMNAWVRHVKSRSTLDELNEALDVLRLGEKRAGIHPFVLQEKMGLALWHLTQKSKEFGAYKMNSYPGYYRISHTGPVNR